MPVFLFMLLVCLLTTPPAHATTVEEALAGCHAPHKFKQHHYPGEDNLATTNNLRRPAGSSFSAPGTPIFFKGKVLDENCVPITGARIDMWQADSEGVLIKNSDGEDFLGAGRTYTNNLGEYSFITVLPGSVKGAAPHLNLGVNATGFEATYTRAYFPDMPENANDTELQEASKNAHPLAVRYSHPGKDDTYFYNMRLTASKVKKEEMEVDDIEYDPDADE